MSKNQHTDYDDHSPPSARLPSQHCHDKSDNSGSHHEGCYYCLGQRLGKIRLRSLQRIITLVDYIKVNRAANLDFEPREILRDQAAPVQRQICQKRASKENDEREESLVAIP